MGCKSRGPNPENIQFSIARREPASGRVRLRCSQPKSRTLKGGKKPGLSKRATPPVSTPSTATHSRFQNRPNQMAISFLKRRPTTSLSQYLPLVPADGLPVDSKLRKALTQRRHRYIANRLAARKIEFVQGSQARKWLQVAQRGASEEDDLVQ